MDTSVVVNHAAQAPQPDPWFRTRSPEEAIHLCETAFYPHRLGLLGPSNSFGLTQRVTCVGLVSCWLQADLCAEILEHLLHVLGEGS